MVIYRKGDVLNFRYENPVSFTISTGMGHYWTHSAVISNIYEDGSIELVEAIGTYRDYKYQPKGLYSKIKFLFKIKEFFGGKVLRTKYPREFLDKLHKENRLKIMDFKVSEQKIDDILNSYVGMPYDYLNIFNIAVKRFLSFFGKRLDADIETTKSLFCSELASRYLSVTTNFNILELANKTSYEEVTPQDISLIYDKLKFFYKI